MTTARTRQATADSSSTSKDSKDSAPIVYINARPPAPIPNPLPTFSPKSSSHGHGTSGSISGNIFGLGGSGDSPPGTPLSPRPCVSRKASANRLNGANTAAGSVTHHAQANNGVEIMAPSGPSSHKAAHRRSVSTGMSISFPQDVMTTFGAATSDTPASNGVHQTQPLQIRRGSQGASGSGQATPAGPTPSASTGRLAQFFAHARNGSKVAEDVELKSSSPSTPVASTRTQALAPASASAATRRYGINSGAGILATSAMSESHHQSHQPGSNQSGLSSPSNKKITLANQYAATQELKEWGSNFWVIISDPGSGQSFFANPHTGECKWEVPSGTFVLPPNPDGQWMEFFDETHGLPYFYHSGKKQSQWARPSGFVIPLTAIQEVNMGRPFGGPAGVKRTPRVSISSDGGHSGIGSDPDVSIISSATAANAAGPSVSFAEPSKAEKRKSIQPPPPSHGPSIDQVLAYRQSIILGKNDLLATALASNVVGVGAPYSTSSNGHTTLNGEVPNSAKGTTSILSSPTKTNESKHSHERHASGSGSGSGSGSILRETVKAIIKSPPRKPVPIDLDETEELNGDTTIRKKLGLVLLSDEMEHIRDTPTPLSQFSNGGGTRDSFMSLMQGSSRPYVSSSQAGAAGSEKDDSTSISSAGTDFMQHVASGRLFGSVSGHAKTGSGASANTFTVSGPGGPSAATGTAGTGTGSIPSSGRDSIASSFSRTSSAMGGFAPIAEENGTGITVKITRPSTSTDGASLASKSGRWTPEFGGSISSWRRDPSSSSSTSGNEGGPSASGTSTPTLRERESLRNMRSPPTSARAAAAATAGGHSAPTALAPMSDPASAEPSLLAPPASSMSLVGGTPMVASTGGNNTWDSSSGSSHSVGGSGGGGGAWSSWRTNSNASATGASILGRGPSSSPGSSQSALNSSLASGFRSGGLGRLGGNSLNGLSTAPSSAYHNGGDDSRAPLGYETEAGGLLSIGSAPAASQQVKSPRLFNALRSKLRNQSSPSQSVHNASSSSQGHRKFDLQGVMHIADRSASKDLNGDDLPPETPEEAYNRRRRQTGPGSSAPATSPVGYGPHAAPKRNNSLGPTAGPGLYDPLAVPPVPPLPKLPTSVSSPANLAGVGAGAGVGLGLGRSPAMTTPGLTFSPRTMGSPSLGSDSSHQHGSLASSSAVPAGQYGLGVGMIANSTGGNAQFADASVNKSPVETKREPFRPSGVNDVVVNSRHSQPGSPASSPGGEGGRTWTSDAKSFEAMLKGYAAAESQVLKGVVGRVKAASGTTTSPTSSSPSRKWL